jgi:cytoskeletal protein CcmA (bactofilin family)/DNA-directed RNA polymerase subunit RPC12/RpoP
MPAKEQDKILLVCPHCGHQQPESRVAFSTICKQCGKHLRVQEILKPSPKAPAAGPKKQLVACFDCGAELEVPDSAESTICKRCSAYVDLHDYNITSALAKNFKTRGAFVIEPRGLVFNSESNVGDAVIRGKFHGKLIVERSLTIYSNAEIKGTLTAGRLLIPEKNHFRWPAQIQVGSAEIAGELAADLRAEGTVMVKAAALLFGNVDARNLVVEEGAVIVGKMQIGPRSDGPQPKLL